MQTRRVFVVAVASAVAAFAASASAQAARPGDRATPIVRGPRVSGVSRYLPSAPAKLSRSGGGTTAALCSQPGNTNFVTNCKSVNSGGRPVNETAIATNGSLLFSGANDYNSYNGQGQDGFYWSAANPALADTGSSWYDAGPIDVFPHNPNNGAGDPGLAAGASDVYYSSLFFNFDNCKVGGVELLYAPTPTGSTAPSWKAMQLESNSAGMFEDKPAITVSGSHLYESWTHFGSCSGTDVTSPIQFEAFSISGGAPSNGSGIQSVPGSVYSQGSALTPDGSGGFWIAWEEFPNATATIGSIRLAHYTGSGFDSALGNGKGYETISPSTFTDLPSPLPGFEFRTNSFPAIALVSGQPEVVWTSYDTGEGLAYLWASGTVSEVAAPLNGGDQFFPSIALSGSQVYVAFSEGTAAYSAVASSDTYDQRLVAVGLTATTVSTAPSYPNKDAFFSGQFIGDYNQMVGFDTSARPMWTDLRGPDCCFSTQQMNAMVYVAG